MVTLPPTLTPLAPFSPREPQSVRTITINVEQKHINKFRSHKAEKNCKICPVSFAMFDATSLEWGVSRSGAYCKRYGRVGFPADLTAYIDRIDNGKILQPATFELSLPEPRIL